MIDAEKPPLDDDLLMHFGIKGMKWGQRKAERKKRDALDGVEYKRSTFEWTKNDPKGPIKKHYSDAEILKARKNQKRRADRMQRATDATVKLGKQKNGYYKYTKELDDAVYNWQEQRDRYVANRKTKGEKRVSILLGGPVGAYLTSDFRTVTRVVNENPTKYGDEGKVRAKKIATNVAIGGTFAAAAIAGKTLGSIR